MSPAALDCKIVAAIAAAIGRARGRDFDVVAVTAAASGSGGTHFALRSGDAKCFVKLGEADRLAAEADGLEALSACDAIRAPGVVALGSTADGIGWLALDWLDLGPGDEAALGRAVAALHQRTGACYGWHRDNYLGPTPQPNAPDDDWPRFFAANRLLPLADALAGQGLAELADASRRLAADLPRRIAGIRPPASLVHGDLWRGNAGFVAGAPALFDPAVHHGDPEGDLAMAALFGGFGPGFFVAYREVHPEPPDGALRRELHQLYHLLNHVRLFGDAYLGAARRSLARLAAILG